jgi:hypothetical protein
MASIDIMFDFSRWLLPLFSACLILCISAREILAEYDDNPRKKIAIKLVCAFIFLFVIYECKGYRVSLLFLSI